MQKYSNSVQDTLGNALSSASVTVYTDSAHTTKATIYSDNGVTPTTNPLTTDSLGEFSFYAADGRYYIGVSKTGITTQYLDDILLFDPNASTGSAYVKFTPSGTGVATNETVQERLRFTRPVLDYVTDATIRANIVAGTNVADCTTYVQNAINSGLNLDFQGYTFYCNNLTQSTASQCFVSTQGIAKIIKNASGALFASTGDSVLCQNINWRGDAATPTFTGDGATFSGNNVMLINCGSRWMTGRALKMTGQRPQVIAQCDIYQTTDATASGYDIEFGVSGTATLYGRCIGVVSTQSTGGILATDTGSLEIIGGQFGKLNIASGTSPAGVNGGHIVGARILGNVTIGISNSTWNCNHFGSSVALTINANVSGVSIDESNSFDTGATVTNNGLGANYIARNTGNAGTIVLKFGDDTSSALMTIDHTSPGDFNFTQVTIPNNVGYRMTSSGGSFSSLSMSAADNLSLTNAISDKAILLTQPGVSGRVIYTINGSNVLVAAATTLTLGDAYNLVVGSTTGTKIGTATTQKLGFFNATPVVQQATTGTATGFTAGAGTAVNDQSTFTGGSGTTAYRISDIVLALKNLGLMAA